MNFHISDEIFHNEIRIILVFGTVAKNSVLTYVMSTYSYSVF